MASILLSIRGDNLEDLTSLCRDWQNTLQHGNVIYIYRGTGTHKVYIGQKGNFLTRHQQHYSGEDRERFLEAGFNKVLVVTSRYFNRSALDDVESQLITYFAADRANARSSVVGYDNEIINRNGGNAVNDYRDREKVELEVIYPLWLSLYGMEWVSSPTLDELRINALVKYSPIKQLTSEQVDLINEITENPGRNYVINGDAGTGKTVLLTHLVANILKDRPNARIGVVVQPNWEETGRKIFKVFGMNNSRLVLDSSTKLIGRGGHYDVIVVDESHKLSRRYGKQHPSFNMVYNIEAYRECNSHLEILQQMGDQIVLMYDVLQAIRPANVTRKMFQSLTEGYEKRFLKTQFRIQTPEGKDYTSDDYINGIKYLLYKDTGLLSSSLTNFNPNFSREVFKDKSDDAYFGYFTEQPIHKLTEWINLDRDFHPEHVDRVLGGLVEPWKQSDGKNPNIMHWHEDDIHRRWNSTQENWINSADDDAEDQIGSVFGVQGIDLNKVGVLIGADLEVGEDGKLRGNPDRFYNTNGTFTSDEMQNPDNRFEFTLFVLNIYYVLLTRGIDGIRLGFWHNDAFREYMEKTLDID